MKTIIKVIIILFSILAMAQDPYSINYTLKDGLPSNNVYSIFQDNNGLLWFTTDVGIVRFDSKTFQLLNTEDGLSDNEVFQIKEDHKGRKWLLTLNGIPSYMLEGKIYNSENSELIKNIKGKSMLVDFYEDKERNIHFGFNKGEIITLTSSNKIIKRTLDIGNLAGTMISNKDVLAITRKGLLNTRNKTIINSLDTHLPLRVYHDGYDTFYSDKNILYQIEENNIIIKVLEVPANSGIINYYKEGQNNSWICTRNGLFHINEKDGFKKHYFKGYAVSDILKDVEGNYWISTLNNGVLLVPSFDLNQEPIKVNCISFDEDNNIWLGGRENDYYIKSANQTIKYNLNSNWRKDNISNIRFQNNKTFVIGKVGVLEIEDDYTNEYLLNANDILINENIIFLASTSTFKLELEQFKRKDFGAMKSDIILNRRSNALAFGKNNNVWIGTNLGLFKYHSVDSIQKFNKNYNGLETSINDIYFDKENELLLVASASKGIKILKNDTIIYSISQKHGLNNNTTNAIEKINSNNYLIGTNKGLNLITIKDQEVEVKDFNSALSFRNKKIYDVATLNDTIYLATDNELVYFNTSYLNHKNPKPICLITSVLSQNKEYTNGEDINFKGNDVSISYNGISYIDQGEVTYYYKINDYNSEWSRTNESQINYKSLASKKYSFSVYCVNGFGEKSNIETIVFTVLKPFWRQIWFIILIAALITTMLLSIWKLRLKYLNRQFEKERKALFLENENVALENQMLALEQKALRLQMNPHFIFNALNTIKGYYSEGNVKEASAYISKFSKLLRLLLENVEQYIPLSLEIEMLTLYLDLTKVRYQDKFDYTITVEQGINAAEISIPTLLFQPIVENAIIHGIAPKIKKGEININFMINNGQLISTITDDGIGRDASNKKQIAEYKSKALNIIMERLQLIEIQEKVSCQFNFYDLKKDGNAIGTKVEIIIPVIKQ